MIHNYQGIFCSDELKHYISQSFLQQESSHLIKF